MKTDVMEDTCGQNALVSTYLQITHKIHEACMDTVPIKNSMLGLDLKLLEVTYIIVVSQASAHSMYYISRGHYNSFYANVWKFDLGQVPMRAKIANYV